MPTDDDSRRSILSPEDKCTVSHLSETSNADSAPSKNAQAQSQIAQNNSLCTALLSRNGNAVAFTTAGSRTSISISDKAYKRARSVLGLSTTSNHTRDRYDSQQGTHSLKGNTMPSDNNSKDATIETDGYTDDVDAALDTIPDPRKTSIKSMKADCERSFKQLSSRETDRAEERTTRKRRRANDGVLFQNAEPSLTTGVETANARHHSGSSFMIGGGGFQIAGSGRRIHISEEAMAHASRMFGSTKAKAADNNNEVGSKHSLNNREDHKTSDSKDLNKKSDNATTTKNNGSTLNHSSAGCGFQMAGSGRQVIITKEAMSRAAGILGSKRSDDGPLNAQADKVRRIENQYSFKTNATDAILDKSSRIKATPMPTTDSQASSLLMKSGGAFQMAGSGEQIQPSKEAMAHANRLLATARKGPPEYDVLRPVNCDLETNKIHRCISSNNAASTTPTTEKHTTPDHSSSHLSSGGGFQMAGSGKQIHLTEKGLARAGRLFGTMVKDNDHKTPSYEKVNDASDKSAKTCCVANSFSVYNKSQATTRAVQPGGGFQMAGSGKQIHLSEEALALAGRIFGTTMVKDKEHKTLPYQNLNDAHDKSAKTVCDASSNSVSEKSQATGRAIQPGGGFQMAGSGKQIHLTEEALARAGRLFGTTIVKDNEPKTYQNFKDGRDKGSKTVCDASSSSSTFDKFQATSRTIQPGGGFQTAGSGKQIHLTDEASARAGRLFGTTMAKDNERKIPSYQNLNDAQEKSAKRVFDEGSDNTFDKSQATTRVIQSGGGFQMAGSGKQIHLTEEALARARGLFGSNQERSNAFDTSKVTTETETPSCLGGGGGFQMAGSGKQIHFSEQALARAGQILGTSSTNKDSQEGHKNVRTPPTHDARTNELAKTAFTSTNCSSFGGFQMSGSGKPIHLTEEAMERANQVLTMGPVTTTRISVDGKSKDDSSKHGGEDRRSTIDSKNLRQPTKLSDPSSFSNAGLSSSGGGGFQIAGSGKPIHLSEDALAQARRLLGTTSSMPVISLTDEKEGKRTGSQSSSHFYHQRSYDYTTNEYDNDDTMIDQPYHGHSRHPSSNNDEEDDGNSCISNEDNSIDGQGHANSFIYAPVPSSFYNDDGGAAGGNNNAGSSSVVKSSTTDTMKITNPYSLFKKDDNTTSSIAATSNISFQYYSTNNKNDNDSSTTNTMMRTPHHTPYQKTHIVTKSAEPIDSSGANVATFKSTTDQQDHRGRFNYRNPYINHYHQTNASDYSHPHDISRTRNNREHVSRKNNHDDVPQNHEESPDDNGSSSTKKVVSFNITEVSKVHRDYQHQLGKHYQTPNDDDDDDSRRNNNNNRRRTGEISPVPFRLNFPSTNKNSVDVPNQTNIDERSGEVDAEDVKNDNEDYIYHEPHVSNGVAFSSRDGLSMKQSILMKAKMKKGKKKQISLLELDELHRQEMERCHSLEINKHLSLLRNVTSLNAICLDFSSSSSSSSSNNGLEGSLSLPTKFTTAPPLKENQPPFPRCKLVDELFATMLVSSNQKSNIRRDLLSRKWIRNHCRWIVWTLACMERRFDTLFVEQLCTKEHILQKLYGRYNIEYTLGHQPSVIRRILHRDLISTSPMILCVTHIFEPQQQQPHTSPNSASAGEGMQQEQPPFPNYDTRRMIELSDGWYFVCAILDDFLSTKLEQGIIAVGTKLAVCNCMVEHLEKDGIDPLDDNYNSLSPVDNPPRFMLFANSTRFAKWNAKLGLILPRSKQRLSSSDHGGGLGMHHPITTKSITDIVLGGGMVPHVNVIVCRRYPILYYINVPQPQSTDSNANEQEQQPRTKRMILTESQLDQYKTDWEMKQQRFYEQCQLPYKEIQRIENDNEDAPMAWTRIIKGECEYGALSKRDQQLVDKWQRSKQDQLRNAHERFTKEQFAKRGYTKKSMTDSAFPFLPILVQFVYSRRNPPFDDRDNDSVNKNATVVVEPETILIKIWRPTEDHVRLLSEGSIVSMTLLNVRQCRTPITLLSSWRKQQQQSSCCNSNVSSSRNIELCTTRSSQITKAPLDDINQSTTVKKSSLSAIGDCCFHSRRYMNFATLHLEAKKKSSSMYIKMETDVHGYLLCGMVSSSFLSQKRNNNQQQQTMVNSCTASDDSTKQMDGKTNTVKRSIYLIDGTTGFIIRIDRYFSISDHNNHHKDDNNNNNNNNNDTIGQMNERIVYPWNELDTSTKATTTTAMTTRTTIHTSRMNHTATSGNTIGRRGSTNAMTRATTISKTDISVTCQNVELSHYDPLENVAVLLYKETSVLTFVDQKKKQQQQRTNKNIAGYAPRSTTSTTDTNTTFDNVNRSSNAHDNTIIQKVIEMKQTFGSRVPSFGRLFPGTNTIYVCGQVLRLEKEEHSPPPSQAVTASTTSPSMMQHSQHKNDQWWRWKVLIDAGTSGTILSFICQPLMEQWIQHVVEQQQQQQQAEQTASYKYNNNRQSIMNQRQQNRMLYKNERVNVNHPKILNDTCATATNQTVPQVILDHMTSDNDSLCSPLSKSGMFSFVLCRRNPSPSRSTTQTTPWEVIRIESLSLTALDNFYRTE